MRQGSSPGQTCCMLHVSLPLRYVGDAMNLKLMMILLKDPSRSIQFEAFHVFKVGMLWRSAAMPLMSETVPHLHPPDWSHGGTANRLEARFALFPDENKHPGRRMRPSPLQTANLDTLYIRCSCCQQGLQCIRRSRVNPMELRSYA